MRISFVNQKGGVGKTTVAALLASALQAAGLSVAILDRDPQGSLGYWATRVGKIPTEAENPEAAFVILDSPGHLDFERPASRLLMSEVVSTADRVVLVSEMSGFSIAAAATTAALVKQFLPETARAGVLFNQVRRQTITGQQDMGELAKTIGLPVLGPFLPLSSAYEQFSALGWGAVTGEARGRVLALAQGIIS